MSILNLPRATTCVRNTTGRLEAKELNNSRHVMFGSYNRFPTR